MNSHRHLAGQRQGPLRQRRPEESARQGSVSQTAAYPDLLDETGYYEYETIHPGAYKTGPETWRPSHIHYYVRATGYKPLITQLYFKGDPHNKTDEFIKESLIIELTERKVNGGVIEAGSFDIVLEPAKATR